MVETILLHVEEAIVAINVLVLHQIDDLVRVLVHINDRLKLVLDLVLHEKRGVLRVSVLMLDVID